MSRALAYELPLAPDEPDEPDDEVEVDAAAVPPPESPPAELLLADESEDPDEPAESAAFDADSDFVDFGVDPLRLSVR